VAVAVAVVALGGLAGEAPLQVVHAPVGGGGLARGQAALAEAGFAVLDLAQLGAQPVGLARSERAGSQAELDAAPGFGLSGVDRVRAVPAVLVSDGLVAAGLSGGGAGHRGDGGHGGQGGDDGLHESFSCSGTGRRSAVLEMEETTARLTPA
jgi:hypothetical protein